MFCNSARFDWFQKSKKVFLLFENKNLFFVRYLAVQPWLSWKIAIFYYAFDFRYANLQQKKSWTKLKNEQKIHYNYLTKLQAISMASEAELAHWLALVTLASMGSSSISREFSVSLPVSICWLITSRRPCPLKGWLISRLTKLE